MKKNPTSEVRRAVSYGPDTSGCPVDGLPELIQRRAYQLFEARGKQPGQELDDWLQAEREIKHHANL
jgi:hypothetical protein